MVVETHDANSGLEKAPTGEAAKFVLRCVDPRLDCDPFDGKFVMVVELCHGSKEWFKC